MGSTSHGGCLCGASSYQFQGDVKFAIDCYCTDCQKVSGGGHLPQIAVSEEAFSSTGPIKTYVKGSDAGNELGFSYCGECGSPLFKSTSKMPDTRFIYAGSLTKPPQTSFDRKVFESSRQPWDAS